MKLLYEKSLVIQKQIDDACQFTLRLFFIFVVVVLIVQNYFPKILNIQFNVKRRHENFVGFILIVWVFRQYIKYLFISFFIVMETMISICKVFFWSYVDILISNWIGLVKRHVTTAAVMKRRYNLEPRRFKDTILESSDGEDGKTVTYFFSSRSRFFKKLTCCFHM